MPDEPVSEDMSVTFPAQLDQRNCIFIPKNIRDFLKVPENAKLSITVKLRKPSESPSQMMISERQLEALKNVMASCDLKSSSMQKVTKDLDIVIDLIKAKSG